MKRIKDFSIKTKYIFILILCVALPMFCLGMGLLHVWVSQYEENADRNHINQLRLTAETVDSFMQHIEEISYELSGSPSVVKFMDEHRSLEEYVNVKRALDAVIDNEAAIKNIQIFKNQESLFSAGRATLVTETENDYISNIIKNDIRRQWGQFHVLYSFGHGKFDVENPITPYYSTIYSDGRFTDNGILAIFVDEEAIYNCYRAVITEATEKIWLMSENGQVLSSPNKELLEYGVPQEYQISTQKQSSGILKVDRHGRAIYWCRCGASDLILCKIEKAGSLAPLKFGYFGMFLLFLVFLLAGCILLYIRYISRPITRLSKELEACVDETADKIKPVSIYRKQDEIGKLTIASNYMIGKINDLIDRVYVEQIRTKQAQLDLVGAQINPHFLFNTIDSIHWTALANKDWDVGEQLEVLSDFLREMLNFGNQDITVAQELKILEDYCFLIQKRFQGRIVFHKKICKALLDCRISKLLIQPLIENAFTHGLERDFNNGELWLIIREKKGRMQIIVMDNGRGCDGKRVREEMKGADGKEYFALRNIQKRLQLKYQNEAKLIFRSVPGKGTLVRMELPIVRQGVEGMQEVYDESHDY
ncbi:MAG: histidine kinase [Eubacteriales bacterium]|nr:histidine kinase [Eubacteriales bacterium]